ncbi:SAC3/GANP/Nin1/mts3/eIF-3 p25 family-domain-containing protein [Xylariaceae sp. FL1019]|nr:SAC3/GANP/Nin1/mts3/eIF-3 p25 family-domain-containing protein [Xylariaceae sp. FL1019]
MLNPQPQGGWGAGATTTAAANPFNSATPPQAGNPFAAPLSNPFAQLSNPGTQSNGPNPVTAKPSANNPFALALKRSASPSAPAQPNGSSTSAKPFQASKSAASAASFGPRVNGTSGTNGTRQVAEFVKPAWPKSTDTANPAAVATGAGKMSNKSQNSKTAPTLASLSAKRKPIMGFADPSKPVRTSQQNHDGRATELARQIKEQLVKDRIVAPKWPANPGRSEQRKAMESFRESYRTYREKARKSLIRAKLIDDPDARRTLRQALDFRGISEEMCPEWEAVTRIVEFDTRKPEKINEDSGELVAVPSIMVKRLARSAAGQDAPLPMDVRSFATLRKTLDYLIDDLIPSDDELPLKHNFLWDRTRAIRIDLSVQKYNLTTDERTDLIYCLETIARFHVTSLHLLSQDGVASEDFSEQQEIEQLGKTLMSLKELYDDCVEQGIECANEAEFRGYYVVFNARNPSIRETVESWGLRMWSSDGIRTAMCLVESIQNTWGLQGPLIPYAPTNLALDAAAIFFSIVATPQISYTMACFAEIHFNNVRKAMLQVIRQSFSRPREGPKDITPQYLKDRLRFDSEEQAIDFAERHGYEFGSQGANRYAILNARREIQDARIRHAFSQNIVERKRSGRSLPKVIHETVYEIPVAESAPLETAEEESLFVSQSDDGPLEISSNSSQQSSDQPMSSTSTFGSSSTATVKPANSPIQVLPPQLEISRAPTPAANSEQDGQNTRSENAPPAKPSASPFVPPSGQGQNPAKRSFGGPQSFGSADLVTVASSDKTQAASWFPKSNPATQQTNGLTAPSDGSAPSVFSFLNTNAPTSKSTQPQSSSTIFSTPGASSLTSDKASTNPIFAFSQPNLEKQSTSELASDPAHPSSELAPPSAFLSSQLQSKDAASLFKQPPPSFAFKPSLNMTPASTKSSSDVQLMSKPKSPILSSDTDREEMALEMKVPTSTASPASALVKKDQMGDFTRWYVLADHGLMQDRLEEFMVEHLLHGLWEDFQLAERERLQREEDEKLEAEAKSLRHRNLQLKYYYRWVDIFRKQRVVKRIRMEKEKARKWRSVEQVTERESAAKAKKERAVEEAKQLMEKRTERRVGESEKRRESIRSRDSLEDALLATGVLNGVRDERAAARNALRHDNIDSESVILPGSQIRLRSENQRRRTRGLPPLKRFPEPEPPKEGTKTAKLRALTSGPGRDSMSMSTGSLRNSTFSSSYRSSLGYNQSRVSKPRATTTDPYWRLKASGLVQMPNGEYLHESLALPMLREGKRFPGLGDYGLPPRNSPSHSPPDAADADIMRNLMSPTPDRTRSRLASRSPSISDGFMQKRKRAHADDDDLTAYRNEAPASRKRPKSVNLSGAATPSEDDDFLASIQNLMSRVETVANSAAP